MKNVMKAALFLLLAGAFIVNFAACSDDDDNNGNGTTDPDAVVFDQMETLQNSIVRLDEKGNFMYRLLGEPLDPADTTRLSVGVEDLAEAKTLFKGLFSPETKMSENGDVITCSPADARGNTVGTVTFTPASGSQDGELASVSFGTCSLKAVSSLHFLQKDAWPDNDGGSPYKKGEKVRRQTLMNGEQEWICLREAGVGVQGILYYLGTTSISADSYRPFISRNKHSQSELQTVRSLLGGAAYWCDDYYCTNGYYSTASTQAGKASCPILEFCFFESNDPLDNTQIGDFYLKDGSVVGNDSPLTDVQKRDCIGIVCWIGDPTGYDSWLKQDHPDCTHGLVMALHNAIRGDDPFDAKEEMKWCNNRERTGATSMDAGYSDTQTLRSYNGSHPSEPVYPVEAIDNYADDFNQDAPSKSSGWYFPAVRELENVYKAKSVLKNQLVKIGNVSWLGLDYYWSSTEYGGGSSFAWYVHFDNGYVGDNGLKNNYTIRVRPLLAF